MKTQLLLAALFAATSVSFAQDSKAPEQKMPNPRHKEHDALKALAGDWESALKMEAMPGVPGMDKACESTGTERAEQICNGLWLKTVAHGTWQGEPMEGVWVVGWDPYQKKYVGLWTCSGEESATVLDGSYDEKTRIWTWQGKTPQGEMRSTLAQLHFDLIRFVQHPYEPAESKLFFSKRLGQHVIDRHRSRRSVVRSS